MSMPTPGFLQVRGFQGHGNWVFAVAFSRDGRHVVSGSDIGTLCLWDLKSGTSRVLEGHDGWVHAVAFSPDGRHIVSGPEDYTLRLWDVASILSCSGDRTLRRWEVSGVSRALEGHGSHVNAVAFSPDGRHILSGSADRTLRLWDVASGASRVLEGHDGWVYAVAFSPMGATLSPALVTARSPACCVCGMWRAELRAPSRATAARCMPWSPRTAATSSPAQLIARCACGMWRAGPRAPWRATAAR
jgi:WD40 repeat protein